MKKTLFFILVLCLSFVVYGQEDKTGLGRAKKLNGIEVYFMSEPLREYKVIFEVGGLLDVKSNAQVKSVATGGIATETISEKANKLATRIIEKATTDGHEVDALIYNSAKTAIAVKFTDEPTEDTKGIARVNKIKNVQIYILCEPLLKYEIINESKAKSKKGRSMMTLGLVNSSIEEDINKLVDRVIDDAKKKRHQIDAVIYSTGKNGNGIKFNE